MNRTLGIVLCSSVVSLSLFSADTPVPSSGSSSTMPDPLAVPPVKPWVQKAREQQEQNTKKPVMLDLLLQRVTGKEEEGKRFHDDPSHRRMIEERLEKLIVNLNHMSAQKTEEFLMMCEQKGIEISHDASAELFKAAYANRMEREQNYIKSIEYSKQLMSIWRANQIKHIQETLEHAQKAAETQNNTYVTSLTQHKNANEEHTKIYTHIMQLAQKLNPQFAPAYATNPALYYDDLEKEFGLKIKMEEQAALATHMREISKLLVAMKQFGKIDMEQAAQDQWFEEWQKAQDEIIAFSPSPNALVGKAKKRVAQRQAKKSATTSQATSSSEGESAIDEAKRRIAARNAAKSEDDNVMANQVQPSSTNADTEQKQ